VTNSWLTNVGLESLRMTLLDMDELELENTLSPRRSQSNPLDVLAEVAGNVRGALGEVLNSSTVRRRSWRPSLTSVPLAFRCRWQPTEDGAAAAADRR